MNGFVAAEAINQLVTQLNPASDVVPVEVCRTVYDVSRVQFSCRAEVSVAEVPFGCGSCFCVREFQCGFIDGATALPIVRLRGQLVLHFVHVDQMQE